MPLSLSFYLFYSILYFPTFLSVYDIHADVIVIDVNLNLNQLDENSGVVLDMHAENNFFIIYFSHKNRHVPSRLQIW